MPTALLFAKRDLPLTDKILAIGPQGHAFAISRTDWFWARLAAPAQGADQVKLLFHVSFPEEVAIFWVTMDFEVG